MRNHGSRVRIVKVSFDLLDQFLTMKPSGLRRCIGITSTAPRDMRIVEVIGRNYKSGFWELLCQSEEFDEVPEGACVPDFTPEFESHYGPELRIGEAVPVLHEGATA